MQMDNSFAKPLQEEQCYPQFAEPSLVNKNYVFPSTSTTRRTLSDEVHHFVDAVASRPGDVSRNGIFPQNR